MQKSQEPGLPGASVYVMAPNIFNVADALSFLTHKYVDQLVCVRQKAPDRSPREIQKCLQVLGICHSYGVQNFEVALQDFLKITDP
jgi:hypothetical protein